MISRYFTTKDLCNRYSISKRTIYRWIDNRNFPQPKLRAFGSTNHWASDDIEMWEDRGGS